MKKTFDTKLINLWAIIEKQRNNWHCPICGSNGRQNTHHLISKAVRKFRYDPKNAISLCSRCHSFDPYLSAHMAPWAFEEWMNTNRPEQYCWWVENRKTKDDEFEQKTYEEIFETLRIEYEKVFGHEMLMGNAKIKKDEISNIINRYNNGESGDKISLDYKVTKSVIYYILKQNNINPQNKKHLTKEQIKKKVIKIMLENKPKKV